ncbi:hypothetical protein [Sorangium sp. So ce1335]|uniref:hypothetical protein n=1 Tax=Sorangium sp. So ce1335 TaxID=3133335 RepID=UPI003F62A1BA
MLIPRTLTTQSDLQLYQARYKALSGLPLDIDFLSRAMVRGFFDGGTLVAGYALNRATPYRYHRLIHPDERDRQDIKEFFAQPDVAELCCIWIDRAAVTPFSRNAIYICSVHDAVRSGARKIVGGSVTPKVAAFQRLTLDVMLYEGRWSTAGEPMGKIYDGDRERVVWNTLKLAAVTYARDTAALLRRRRATGGRRAPAPIPSDGRPGDGGAAPPIRPTRLRPAGSPPTRAGSPLS